MVEVCDRGGRMAAWLLFSAWVIVALAMADPVVEWVLQKGFRGLPWIRGGLPDWIHAVLLVYAALVVVAVVVLLRRLPPARPGPLVDWHTRALRTGGIVLLLAGAGNLAYVFGPVRGPPGGGHPDQPVVRASRFFGAFVFGATGALLFAAFLARRRGWRAAASLTMAANLVLGAFVPAGTFLLLLWWFAVRRSERPAPGPA